MLSLQLFIPLWLLLYGLCWLLPWLEKPPAALHYFFMFFVISLYSFQSKTRSLVTGIAINLFVWLAPFIPMVCVGAYYESRERNDYRFDDYYEEMQRNLARAEWIGVILLLVLLVTYIHRVYRKWYASPEE